MKAGQLVSFIFETLPDEAQAALATLQADAAPMAPSLAAGVVEVRARRAARAGVPRLERPAGRGGEHRPGPPRGHPRRASTSRSRCSTPGVDDAIESDLDAAEVMYAMFSAMMLKGLDAKGARRRAPRADARGARLRARGGATSASSGSSSPAIRGCASRGWSRSSRPSACSPPSGSTGCRSRSSVAPPVARDQAARRRGDLAVRPARRPPPRRASTATRTRATTSSTTTAA